MDDLRTRCMQFLYKWVTEGKLSNMRKGQVEELEAFVSNEQARAQAQASAARIQAEQDNKYADQGGRDSQ